MTLDELKEGQKARIFKVKGRGAFRQRLVEMGFVKGQTVETLRFAPMKDPVEFRILHSEVSLRRDEAALIEIELMPAENRPIAMETDGGQNATATPDRASHPGHAAKPTPTLTAATAFPSARKETIEVCMVGNPNAGKTSLYNALSGAFEHVANYSGVTVDAKSIGFDYRDYRIELTDLPGTYSFSPYTPEERFVREHLLHHQPDVVLNVVDASNIERNLYLTTQLIDMDCKVVLAVNMFDELKKTGARLDTDLLGQLLGMPVVPTVASRHEGIAPLADKIAAVYNDAEPHLRHTHIPYPEEIETAIRKLQELIWKDPAFSDMYSSRFLAIKFLEQDAEVLQPLRCLQDFKTLEDLAQTETRRIKAIFDEDPAHLMSDARYAFIRGALKEAYTPAETPSRQKTLTDRLDSILTHRLWGFPIFLCFLWLMFQTTFALGQYPMDWIQYGMDTLDAGLERLLPDSMLKAMLLDGILSGIGGVIVFLPNILILFTFISFMETTGYMARVAFIMDKLMHTIGLHGKSFIPLIIGFGCNVPAVMATRTIENRKDRLITMLIIPFMSCSARLPIYILLVGAFFPAHAGSVIFLIYLAGTAVGSNADSLGPAVPQDAVAVGREPVRHGNPALPLAKSQIVTLRALDQDQTIPQKDGRHHPRGLARHLGLGLFSALGRRSSSRHRGFLPRRHRPFHRTGSASVGLRLEDGHQPLSRHLGQRSRREHAFRPRGTGPGLHAAHGRRLPRFRVALPALYRRLLGRPKRKRQLEMAAVHGVVHNGHGLYRGVACIQYRKMADIDFG